MDSPIGCGRTRNLSNGIFSCTGHWSVKENIHWTKFVVFYTRFCVRCCLCLHRNFQHKVYRDLTSRPRVVVKMISKVEALGIAYALLLKKSSNLECWPAASTKRKLCRYKISQRPAGGGVHDFRSVIFLSSPCR